jgi:hypothetical protein
MSPPKDGISFGRLRYRTSVATLPATLRTLAVFRWRSAAMHKIPCGELWDADNAELRAEERDGAMGMFRYGQVSGSDAATRPPNEKKWQLRATGLISNPHRRRPRG